MLKKLLFSLYLILWAGLSWAQIAVSSSVDKTSLTLDDEITLTVTVQGAVSPLTMPQLPSLPAFNVYSREIDQTTINGKSTSVFRYVMLPRFVGKTDIGSVTVKYNGKTYKTDPISISIYRNSQGVQKNRPATSTGRAVSNGNYDSSINTAISRQVQKADESLPALTQSLMNQAYARGNENYFLVSAVSNKKPYVNEAVTLAVRFYYSREFYDAPYQKPAVYNLFMEDAGSAEGTQSINGILYRYNEQRYTVTGAAPGAATIGEARVQYRTGSASLSPLDRLFGGSALGAEKTAESKEIPLQIRPLPAGKPNSFYGAVGQGYTLSASADRTQVEAGEAVTVTVTVKGPGNLKGTGDLTWPQITGFKMYPAAAAAGSLPSYSDTVRGYKEFKTVLVPSASGIYAVPPIKWSYFNPVSGQYKTLQTEPITLSVSPSTKKESGFDFGAAAHTGNGFQTLGKDIAYLKNSYAPEPSVLARLSAGQKANWVALIILGISVFFASFGKKSMARKRAYTHAKNSLKRAISDEQVAEALSGYLQQKLGIGTGSLPLRAIVTALQKSGVTPATAEAFSLLWQRLETARFAPGSPDALDPQNLSAQGLDILKLMEEETK